MAEPQTQPAATGDWQLRGMDAEQKFAQTPMRDDCIDAANRAQRKLRRFPLGPMLYWRIVRGETCFDRDIVAQMIGLARSYTRAKKLNGHRVVARRGRRNNWIAQCGVDVAEFAIAGYFPETAEARAVGLSVDSETYRRVRNRLAACLLAGFNTAMQEIRYQLMTVERENRETRRVREPWEGYESAGCVTIPKENELQLPRFEKEAV